ncbi:MAG: hypothetical protein ABR955_00245 [Verrucomicrobiota bacterium]
MSLINDALKRAQAAQQETSPPVAPPLPPVEVKPRGGTGWFLPLLVILFLAAACFFIGMAFARRTPPPFATVPEKILNPGK